MSKINWRHYAKNLAIVIITYALTTLLAFVLDFRGIHSENLLTLYLLGIIIIVTETKSFLTTVLSSVLFIMTHNFMFLEPKYDWHTPHDHGFKSFALSAGLFLIVALIVNLLVSRLQRQMAISKQNVSLHKKLYKASEGLISIHGKDKVIEYADDALTELTGSEVEFFFDIDKNDENEAKKWCYKNSASCGHGEVEFPDAGHKYIPIRSNKKTVGVVSIDCSQHELSDEAVNCVTALLSQITIAIERAELEAEKQAEAEMRAREHLKAAVTKNISHDMYPRALEIYKNAKSIREGMNLMEESEIIDKLKVIEDESDFIVQTVDNLLDINKDR